MLMASTTIHDLLKSWQAGDTDGTFYDACMDEPEIAWEAILKIIRERDLSPDEEALLAAGPLEDLLAWHGGPFIDRIEAEAGRNARFNHLLGGVWRREMPQEIWERIQAVRLVVW